MSSVEGRMVVRTWKVPGACLKPEPGTVTMPVASSSLWVAWHYWLVRTGKSHRVDQISNKHVFDCSIARSNRWSAHRRQYRVSGGLPISAASFTKASGN